MLIGSRSEWKRSSERRSTISILVDAGPLFAQADVDDPHHRGCRELLATHQGPLIVPMLVLCEVTYLLGERLGNTAEVRFIGDLAVGNFIAEPVVASDWLRIAELVKQYADLSLGTVDASIIAAAERLGVQELATLDHRHFSVVRPRHMPSFRLLP